MIHLVPRSLSLKTFSKKKKPVFLVERDDSSLWGTKYTRQF